MATKTRAEVAGDKARVLDEHTNHLLESVKKKNNKALAWFIVSWSVLFVLGVVGIFYQNRLATQNKNHIDCIVKLLATPSSPGQSRHITDLSTCKIKVT